MEFRVLGGHQTASAEGRPISFLVDGVTAIDAGGLTEGLSIAEQHRIERVVVTHQHFDHLRDLPLLGLAALTAGRQIDIYCSQIVHDVLRQTVLNRATWLDFFDGPTPAPTFRHELVVPGQEFTVGEARFAPIDNRYHTVPVIAYEVTGRSGGRILYTGDTGPGIREIWPAVEPQVLITEVTYPNRFADAGMHGHLTARLLEEELVAFRDLKGYLPRVLVCHINQTNESAVREELAEVAQRLRARVDIAEEGMRIEV